MLGDDRGSRQGEVLSRSPMFLPPPLKSFLPRFEASPGHIKYHSMPAFFLLLWVCGSPFPAPPPLLPVRSFSAQADQPPGTHGGLSQDGHSGARYPRPILEPQAEPRVDRHTLRGASVAGPVSLGTRQGDMSWGCTARGAHPPRSSGLTLTPCTGWMQPGAPRSSYRWRIRKFTVPTAPPATPR